MYGSDGGNLWALCFGAWAHSTGAMVKDGGTWLLSFQYSL